jgi:PAS domain S-box-containing protein
VRHVDVDRAALPGQDEESLMAKLRRGLNAIRLPHLPLALRYATAPAATLFAYLIQTAVLPRPEIAPFVFFYFGVALASSLAGRIPGLVAVLLSAATADYFFLPPWGQWSHAPAELNAVVLFVISASAVALLCGSLRGAIQTAARTTQRLSESRGRWQALFEHAPIAVWEVDFSAVKVGFDELRSAGVSDLEVYFEGHPDEVLPFARAVRVVDVSRATVDLFRFRSLSDVPGRLGAVFDEASLPVFAQELAALFRGETSFGAEMPIRDTFGKRRVVQVRLSVAPGSESTLSRVIVSFVDLTDRLEAERALATSEERYRGLFESSREAILASDRDGRITAANPAALEMLGYDRYELLGRTYRDVTPEPWHELIATELAKARERGYSDVYEKELRRYDGSTLPVSVRVWSGDGQGMWAFVRDVTERNRMEQALRESNARKDEFLAILSHELRNPLAPIRNSLYILDRAAPGGEQAKRAKSVIDRQAAHLTRLVDDLLDLTRIARGKVELKRETLELGELVHGAMEDLRSLFEAAGVGLELRATDTPLPVVGDRDRLGQVVGNLLQNAVKFTDRGGRAVISVERTSDDHALVRVSDTGLGIGRQTLIQLFEPFMQGDRTLERSRGGLGLGLALVKGLVELHGGTVAARSDGPGKGAEFVVRLPLAPGVQPSLDAAALTASASTPRHRILVIEDNPDAADSLRELLELEGHTVEVAYSGFDGIQEARRFRPDVVLCDIGLPKIDGYEVARAMRADPELRHLFLVALTGYALPEDIKQAEAAGFDRHLAKPPTDENLQEVLAEAADLEPPAGRRDSAVMPRRLRSPA